ncbi:MAG TPA: BON domain-containing protein [Candidatus Sulfotelmatobacter sp.]|nr:BON domain-containing protein [Candidatus Sulfotelmatobacter sp.]
MKRAPAALAAFAILALSGCNGGGGADEPQPFGARSAQTVIEDGLILAAVKAKLTADEPNSTTTLGVGVDSGVVTLRGSVLSAAERARAVADARGVRGVKRVVDDLGVNPHGPRPKEQVADFALAARVELAIQSATGLVKVGVRVDHGVATLTGSVNDAKTRDRVVAAARGTDGVRNVVDQLRVGGT